MGLGFWRRGMLFRWWWWSVEVGEQKWRISNRCCIVYISRSIYLVFCLLENEGGFVMGFQVRKY